MKTELALLLRVSDLQRQIQSWLPIELAYDARRDIWRGVVPTDKPKPFCIIAKGPA